MDNRSFGATAAIDGLALVTGPAEGTSRTSNKLYASADGRTWGAAPPPEASSSLLIVVGSDPEGIYVKGSNAMWVAQRVPG
jgi:hypothetical protein